ncbi:hypothetical protein RB195_001796 [Necator americanus]|uniref:Uncharacterized protein n=1 Tax=Necator americanus TaxID=51031 RepID=A0ABR1DFY7_NECAM
MENLMVGVMSSESSRNPVGFISAGEDFHCSVVRIPTVLSLLLVRLDSDCSHSVHQSRIVNKHRVEKQWKQA